MRYCVRLIQFKIYMSWIIVLVSIVQSFIYEFMINDNVDKMITCG